MSGDRARVIARIQKLVDAAPGVKPNGVDAWRDRARLAVRAAYGEDSSAMNRFDEIRYSLPIWTDTTPDSAFANAALAGVREATGLLEGIIEDLEDEAAPEPGTEQASDEAGRAVFVVHGRDEAVRERVARFLERLRLQPIILQERTDQGRTIIEKFEANALDVAYAVVLLTPDDFGRGPEDADWPAAANRARQNVILELGHFMGSLGRRRTAALYTHGTELPSDIHGMLYIPLDTSWELRLAREMRDAGLPVDLNLL